MIKKILKFLPRPQVVILGILLWPTSSMLASVQPESRAWKFAVSVDDVPIGYHQYEVRDSLDGREVTSLADFKYRLMFVTLFRYEHENTERWSETCLQYISSKTRMNRKKYAVDGAVAEDRFVVDTLDGNEELPACVQSFAYWDKSFLEEKALLNAQTGELEEVNIESRGESTVNLPTGDLAVAERYSIATRRGPIDVWYEKGSDRWLQLQSITEQGRVLRYQPLELP